MGFQVETLLFSTDVLSSIKRQEVVFAPVNRGFFALFGACFCLIVSKAYHENMVLSTNELNHLST